MLNDALETPEFDTVDLLVDVLNAADHHDFGMNPSVLSVCTEILLAKERNDRVPSK